MRISFFYILICLVFATSNLNAQGKGWSIFPTTISMDWDYTEDLDMRAYISSSSILNQDIDYTVIALDIPAQWQEHVLTQFCDIQSCYDFRWFKLGDQKSMKLNANLKNGILKVDFLLPSDTSIKVQPGSAEIALGFNLKGEPMSDTLRFLVNRPATGVKESIGQDALSFNLLGDTHFSAGHQSGITSIMVYDLTGTLREVHACEKAIAAIISMDHYSRGMYLIRVKAESGEEYSRVYIR